MMTLQGEALARSGVSTTVFDLSSTGDSSGGFEEASWENWTDDARAVIEAAGEAGASAIRLLGIRLGAALALEVAHAADYGIDRIALWQPVASGAVHLTQFLRLRIAAAMTGGASGETTKGLRERLASGETLEVGGYPVTGALADALEAATLADTAPRGPVFWMEVMSQEPGTILPASERVIKIWRDGGAEIQTCVVEGDPFWSIQETTLAPALIRKTTEILAKS